MCPVTLQAAVILLFGRRVTNAPPLLTCDVCNDLFETEAALQDHIIREHPPPQVTWNQARDCINGLQCSHCGTVLSSTTAVRLHITYGRCPDYDPMRTTTPMPLDAAITHSLDQGTVLQDLGDPEQRLQWTTHCQMCDQAFARPHDLSQRIQRCHGDLLREAQPIIQMLLECWYRVNALPRSQWRVSATSALSSCRLHFAV